MAVMPIFLSKSCHSPPAAWVKTRQHGPGAKSSCQQRKGKMKVRIIWAGGVAMVNW